ncbi:hypothetical protein J1614_010902 [Plenodomus biglobosus]|nr:hypothetical protein J1614_010902 [Plenodomus biglobosus]
MYELVNIAESRRLSQEDIEGSPQYNDNEPDSPEYEPLIDQNLLPRYASVPHLGPWIPETDPKNPRARNLSVRLSQRQTMLKLQAGMSTVFAALTLGLMAWANMTFPVTEGIGTFMIGIAPQYGIGIQLPTSF